MKIKIPKLKILKNNRWFFSLVLIFILVAGWIIFDYKSQKEPIKKDVAGIAQQKSNANADNPKTDTSKVIECFNGVPKQQSISELIENLNILYYSDNFKMENGTYSKTDFEAKLDKDQLFYNEDKTKIASILTIWEGGTGKFKYLVVAGIDYCQIKDLGDRTIIQNVQISKDDDSVSVTGLFHGPNDGECCPTVKKTITFSREKESDQVYNLEIERLSQYIKNLTANNIQEKQSCKYTSGDIALENLKKLPEVTKSLANTVIKDDIKYYTALDLEEENDKYYFFRLHHAEKDLREPPRKGDYLMLTYNQYVVDKCTGKPITSRWLHDENGNTVSFHENPEYLDYDANRTYTQTIFW